MSLFMNLKLLTLSSGGRGALLLCLFDGGGDRDGDGGGR